MVLIRHVNLEITNGCNQRCIYCFNNSGPVRNNELSLDGWIEVIDHLQKRGLESVLVTGGEPFVREDIWEFLKCLQIRGLEINILSNGYSINDRLPRWKQELLRSLRRAQISLDSANPEIHNRRRGCNGAWITAITAVNCLRQWGIEVEISMTVSSDTLTELEGVAEVAYQTGSKLLVRPLINQGRAKSIFKGKDQHLELKLESKKEEVEQKYGSIIVDDFACYVPLFPEIDLLNASKGIFTLKSDGSFRGISQELSRCPN